MITSKRHRHTRYLDPVQETSGHIETIVRPHPSDRAAELAEGWLKFPV